MALELTLTDSDRIAIARAVHNAEAETSGEIVPILAEVSDSYEDVALAWSALVAMLALAALTIAPHFYLALVDRMMGWWGHEWPPRAVFTLALAVAVIKFIAMWLLQLWRPLRLALVPGRIKRARVQARAIAAFKLGTERRTRAATGVVIYLSRAERRAEIVADAAIAGKVPAQTWAAPMAAMLAEIRAGRLASGLVVAIAQVGAIIAPHFPRGGDDINELPDRLIEV